LKVKKQGNVGFIALPDNAMKPTSIRQSGK